MLPSDQVFTSKLHSCPELYFPPSLHHIKHVKLLISPIEVLLLKKSTRGYIDMTKQTNFVIVVDEYFFLLIRVRARRVGFKRETKSKVA